jgi:hypothetical protein
MVTTNVQAVFRLTGAFLLLMVAFGKDNVPKNLASECVSHEECGPQDFCRRFFHLRESDGVVLPFTKCSSCLECSCHSYAIDGRCPTRCGIAAQEVAQLKGVWFGTAKQTSECLEVWSFDDLAFTSLIQMNNFSNAQASDQQGSLACPKSPVYGGRRYGTFSLDTSSYPARLTLTYDDRHTNGSSTENIRTATVHSICPEVCINFWKRLYNLKVYQVLQTFVLQGLEIRWDHVDPSGTRTVPKNAAWMKAMMFM